MLHHNGSTDRWRAAQFSKGVPRDQVPNAATVRRIVHEQTRTHTGNGISWNQQLEAICDTFRFAHPGGYVQTLMTVPDLYVAIFHHKQLEW